MDLFITPLFTIGPFQIVVIVVVALIVFGPVGLGKKLGNHEIRALEKESNYHLLRNKALELLALREHSSQELKRKLSARFQSHESEIERCIEELQSEDYLSEQRYTRLFIESKLISELFIGTSLDQTPRLRTSIIF